MNKKPSNFLSKWADACKREMQKRSELHKTSPFRKGRKKQKPMVTGKPPAPPGRAADMRLRGLWRAQRSELVAALVLPVHCQLAISGRSTPCAAMYCRCSTSLSRICCTA